MNVAAANLSSQLKQMVNKLRRIVRTPRIEAIELLCALRKKIYVVRHQKNASKALFLLRAYSSGSPPLKQNESLSDSSVGRKGLL